MAHYAKYQLDGSLHLIDHDKREHTSLQEHIDPSRSHLNYNLVTHEEGEKKFFLMRKKQALETGSRFNKRSVALLSCVVTLPKDFPFKNDPDKVKEFFEECVKYLHKYHGEENCVSAWVHFDETSSHVHYKTMPLLWQKNKEEKEVLQFNAKAILCRSYLQKFHEGLQRHLSLHFGEPIHILNGETENGNLAVEQLKQNSKALEEEISSIQEHFELQKETLSKALQSIEKTVSQSVSIEPLKVKKDRVVLSKGDYETLIQNTYTTKEKEGILSTVKHLKDILCEFAFGVSYKKQFLENQSLKKELQTLKKKFHSLLKKKVQEELETCVSNILEENETLRNENTHLKNLLSKKGFDIKKDMQKNEKTVQGFEDFER